MVTEDAIELQLLGTVAAIVSPAVKTTISPVERVSFEETSRVSSSPSEKSSFVPVKVSELMYLIYRDALPLSESFCV